MINSSVRNRFHFLFILPLILLTTLVLPSCSKDSKADWTILVYMAADNDLTQQAIDDIIQMEEASVSSSINIIVQLDPNQYSTNPEARRYRIKHNRDPQITSPVIEYLGEIDSGDYYTLAQFVNWTVNKYPASRYALFIWSHGSGWTRDENEQRWICPDNDSLNQISIANGEFKNAFQLFPRKMDILVLDACFMQTIEVITEVYQYNDYIVGSENSVPYEGFPYKEILELWNVYRSPRYLASAIVEQYITAHEPGGSQNPGGFERKAACSAASSAQLPPLLALITNFVENWYHIANSDEILFTRENSYSFNIPKTEADIYEFFSNLYLQTDNQELKADVEEILQAINNLFVAYDSSFLPENTGTATVWFPIRNYDFYGGIELYSKLDFALTDWAFFVERTIDD